MTNAVNRLRHLLQSGELHHATYRGMGTVWEGLWFYRRSKTGFRGYELDGAVLKNDPDIDAAMALVAHTGISVGSYGCG